MTMSYKEKEILSKIFLKLYIYSRRINMFDDVKEIIVDTLGCQEDSVTMDSNLFDDLGADSLDAVELSLAIEEKTGISIDQDAMVNIKTVADIMDYLEEHK